MHTVQNLSPGGIISARQDSGCRLVHTLPPYAIIISIAVDLASVQTVGTQYFTVQGQAHTLISGPCGRAYLADLCLVEVVGDELPSAGHVHAVDVGVSHRRASAAQVHLQCDDRTC